MAGNPEILDHEIPAELRQLQADFGSLIAEAEARTSLLSYTQFNWHPRPGAWSVGQCLDHLNVSHGKFLRAIRKVIDDALPPAHPQQVRSTLFGKFYFWLLEPPVRKTFPAPKPFVPTIGEKEPQIVLKEFRTTHHEFIEEIRRASRTDINRPTVRSPISKYLRLNLYDAFRAIAAHGRRHLWQADQIRSAPGFPSE